MRIRTRRDAQYRYTIWRTQKRPTGERLRSGGQATGASVEASSCERCMAVSVAVPVGLEAGESKLARLALACVPPGPLVPEWASRLKVERVA
jgi:hypothetical protein